MLPLMIVLTIGFILSVFYLIRCYTKAVEADFKEEVLEAQRSFEHLLSQKERIDQEKKALEKEAMDVFVLYEMTREITKKPHESEAFKVFKEKLHKTISLEDCQFVPAFSGEHVTPEPNQEYFIFNLKSKNRKLGYLSFKGLDERDRDKVMILGHQFALALRRVKLYQEIEELSVTDSLSGLHTRRYFLQRFDEELKRSASRKIDLSFLIIDVDHFKSFNDKYGHMVGDQILKRVGALIRESVRGIDVVGRYGGEEFCVVLPDTNREGAFLAAERIRVAIQEATIYAYDAIIRITVSVGLSNFPKDGKAVEELIDKADWALYRSKKRGRNCTCAFGLYEL